MQGLVRAVRVCKWLMVLIGVAAAVTALRGAVLHGRGPLPGFEVISVRPTVGESPRGGQWRRQGDRFTMRAVTLEELVMFAYGLGNANELAGVPAWGRSERFDVQATLSEADARATAKLGQDDWDEQMRLRMQRVLAERFHLQVSFEKKELPVFVVTVAKGGFQCKPATNPNAVLPLGEQPRFFNPIPPPPPPPPPSANAQGGPPRSVDTGAPQQAMSPMNWRIRGWPVWYIVRLLASAPEMGGRVYVDHTGLSGNVDCDLSWVPAGMDIPGPSLYTAVQEQLGLKVTAGRQPVEIVNVTHAERLTEN